MTASDVAAIPAAARVNLPDDKPLTYIIQVQRNQFWATPCTDLWKIWHVGPLGPVKFNFNQFSRVGTRPPEISKISTFW